MITAILCPVDGASWIICKEETNQICKCNAAPGNLTKRYTPARALVWFSRLPGWGKSDACSMLLSFTSSPVVVGVVISEFKRPSRRRSFQRWILRCLRIHQTTSREAGRQAGDEEERAHLKFSTCLSRHRAAANDMLRIYPSHRPSALRLCCLSSATRRGSDDGGGFNFRVGNVGTATSHSISGD